MRRYLSSLVAVVTLLGTGCGGGDQSSPSTPSLTLSDYRSAGYSYILGGTAGTIAPSDTAGWAATNTHSSAWQAVASAPFGDNSQNSQACAPLYYSGGTSGGTYLVVTAWPAAPTSNAATSDLLVTKSFVMPSPATVKIDVAVDNDIQVFVDGNDVTASLVAKSGLWSGLANGFQTHGDCAEPGSGTFSATGLGAGTHLLAIHAKDRGGVTYLDTKLYSELQ
jgi:hypothetical protein